MAATWCGDDDYVIADIKARWAAGTVPLGNLGAAHSDDEQIVRAARICMAAGAALLR